MRSLAMLLLLLAPDAGAVAQEIVPPLPHSRPEVAEEAAEASVPLPRPRPAETPVPEIPAPPSPRTHQAACPAVLAGAVVARLLEPIEDGFCESRSPLAVSAVLANGRLVPLSSEAVLGCGMASLLPDWVAAVDGYLASREQTRLARLLVGTSYACRPRNNRAGAELSEHGFANALDVVGFELEDGRVFSLPGGWQMPDSSAGRVLRFAHGAACSRFTTTLGPEANVLHADHLHLDVGCHGESCAARLCQ